MNDPLEALSGYVQGLRDENTRLRWECGQLRGVAEDLRVDLAALSSTITKFLTLVGGQPAAAEPEVEPVVHVLPLADAETTVASAEVAVDEPAAGATPEPVDDQGPEATLSSPGRGRVVPEEIVDAWQRDLETGLSLHAVVQKYGAFSTTIRKRMRLRGIEIVNGYASTALIKVPAGDRNDEAAFRG